MPRTKRNPHKPDPVVVMEYLFRQFCEQFENIDPADEKRLKAMFRSLNPTVADGWADALDTTLDALNDYYDGLPATPQRAPVRAELRAIA